MKRSLIKQFIVLALFTCSLSADVPDVREQAARDEGPTTRDAWQATDLSRVARDGGRRPDVGLVANRMGVCSFGRRDDCAKGMPVPLSAPLSGAMPDFMASVFWPLSGLGFPRVDRSCVRWELPAVARQETMSVPADPLDAAFLVPRYQMTLALQEYAWLRPAGHGEPALSSDVAYPTDRVDMDAMIARLKKIFMKEGVPQQWVWVAQVESAFNPQAKSLAGAAGLFQLMPGTAQRFGLQTAPVDDRMEPEKSAGAAAQYLKFLHQEFGCWSLALAAYNAGEGRVKEIMKRRNACTFAEVERYLPSETRAYVPKVMAIVALREDRLHGVRSAYWMP